jgi:DnaJ-class molecular chaperone
MSKLEIKRLYLTLAKQTHPDSPNYTDAASSDFSEIASAYKTLTDDKLRKRYDRELAAEEFKDDVVAMAAEVAKEYGPSARKFYEDWALPFLKRTTAGTVAISRVMSEVATASDNSASDNNGGSDGVRDKARPMGSRRGTAIEKGATLSEVMSEMSEMERNGSGSRALEDFGRAFQRVVEAGRNATRQIDGIELQEKSMELRMR